MSSRTSRAARRIPRRTEPFHTRLEHVVSVGVVGDIVVRFAFVEPRFALVFIVVLVTVGGVVLVVDRLVRR